MREISITEARNHLAEMVDRLSRREQSVLIHRRGEAVAAIVSVRMLRRIEKLIEALEDREDLEEARRVLNDPDDAEIPIETLLKKRGL